MCEQMKMFLSKQHNIFIEKKRIKTPKQLNILRISKNIQSNCTTVKRKNNEIKNKQRVN